MRELLEITSTVSNDEDLSNQSDDLDPDNGNPNE